MRWVDRGPEPTGVAGYRREFTEGWVSHIRDRLGGRPTDSYWRQFRTELGRRFSGKCGYCERRCEDAAEAGGLGPTVDHFRPISQSPRLTYRWSNWIFSCSRCNDEKADKWQVGGFVDPCATAMSERPDEYFGYDARTGEIVPKAGLSDVDRHKALRTIAAIGLNKWDILIRRAEWIREIQRQLMQAPFSEWATIFDHYTSEPAEYCGITRMFLSQYQRPAR
ncbi:MAG: hypothetical protein F4X64_08175 [Chloroflexi bacterium]|nr:hypothetical protein [Chloroflexota bacterium]